jgi:hypothetical protein
MGGLSHPAVVESGLGSGSLQPNHKQLLLINTLAHIYGYKISANFLAVC